MNARLTLIVFIAVPVIVGLIRLFGRKVKKHSARVQEALSVVTSSYQETLHCLKVVQGYSGEERATDRFRIIADRLYRKVMRWNRWFLGLGPMMDSTVFIVLPGVLVVGKVYFHHSLGELMSMIYAFSRVYAPIKSLARVNNELKTLQGATDRVFSILRTVPDIRDREKTVEFPVHRGTITYDHVFFFYEKGTSILTDISFSVSKGEMAAFVGSTGAGKSTILDLLPRFYDVGEGRILIDGVDIRDVTLKSLRERIGIVSQDILLFHDTIANNILYGSMGKGMEDVIRAAEAAHAHAFITKQPKGYETIIGDQGTLLSGGQRQRIAIARALIGDPPILILDEAASALDAESEKLVQRTIENLRGEKTILVVAHRLSTVQQADKIFVLEEGRIIESGNRKALLDQGGRFKQLYDMQFNV
jgi:subfamily B ATP-binding cassette protein MsbA